MATGGGKVLAGAERYPEPRHGGRQRRTGTHQAPGGEASKRKQRQTGNHERDRSLPELWPGSRDCFGGDSRRHGSRPLDSDSGLADVTQTLPWVSFQTAP